jgi:mono/diheme cytochrome c family protein
MPKPVRIVLRIVGGLVGLVLLVVLTASVVSGMRLRKHYDVAGKTVPLPSDSASLARGKALAALYGCSGCHTSTLAGQQMIDAFPFAKLASSNLTRGEGGIGGQYSDADWDRAVRHGVKRDGTPLFIMPSHVFNRMSDDEFGRVLAYVKSVPPVNQDGGPARDLSRSRACCTPSASVSRSCQPSRSTTRRSAIRSPRRERRSSTASTSPPPASSATARTSAARRSAGARRTAVAANRCQQRGQPVDRAQFVQTMRSGVTPEGRTLRAQYMPWDAIGTLHDDELHALYTVPAPGARSRRRRPRASWQLRRTFCAADDGALESDVESGHSRHLVLGDDPQRVPFRGRHVRTAGEISERRQHGRLASDPEAAQSLALPARADEHRARMHVPRDDVRAVDRRRMMRPVPAVIR